MRLLREKLDLRIAGGELDREMSELRDLIAEGCLDVLQPDVVSVGGITGLAKIAAMAGEHGIAFTPHSWGNGIGVMANAQLMGGATDGGFFEFPWDPPEWTNARRDFMFRTPLDVDADGDLVLPDAPGLGFELDEDMLARTRVDGGTIRSNN
jgi:L-alanine-DL-glutamate epimerase-like enolase superfamily enzyme